MTEVVTYQGTCAKCQKMVDLVDSNIDPDDARYMTDYYDCSEHEGQDGRCEGSDKSPLNIPALETHWDDDDDFLTMGDIDPDEISENDDY